MKWLWIILGIVVVVCCGGGGFLGWSIYSGTKQVSDAAGKYGDESITAICTNWDAEALTSRAAPELKAQNPEGTLEGVIETLSAALGPMKSFESKIIEIEAQNKNGQSWTEVKMTAAGQFEKGPGSLELTLLKRDDKWSILRFSGAKN